MGKTLIDRVETYIEENGMIPDGGAVCTAVSGGADSVCLLSVLKELAPAHGWEVRAVHVNHRIRKEEAGYDETFVKNLCESWGIRLTAVSADVPAYAEENKLSLEEAGRSLRYRALEEAASAWEGEGGLPPGSVRIALAHHADDNAETILHHLLRGSGLRGLGGMLPVSGRRIRPFLCIRREEIRSYLTEKGIGWREDSSNEDTSYTRNRIRHVILPLMTETVNPQAVENILRAGGLIARADEYLTEKAKEIFSRSGYEKEGEAGIDLAAFCAQDPLIRSYILRLMTDHASPGRHDITARHYEMLDGLAFGKVGSAADLPGCLKAERSYHFLCIRQKPEEAAGQRQSEEIWELTSAGGRCGPLCFTVFMRDELAEIPKNKYTKWFDYDKINDALSVRTRKSGDFITLAGGGHKSLNRFFIDEKIPAKERDFIPLLAEGNHILWVVGYRISEYYKITRETKLILQAEKTED